MKLTYQGRDDAVRWSRAKLAVLPPRDPSHRSLFPPCGDCSSDVAEPHPVRIGQVCEHAFLLRTMMLNRYKMALWSTRRSAPTTSAACCARHRWVGRFAHSMPAKSTML